MGHQLRCNVYTKYVLFAIIDEYDLLPRKTLNSIRTDLGSIRHGQLVHPRCFSDNAELPLLFWFIWRLAVSGAAAPSSSIEDCLDTCTSTLVSHHTRIAAEETELLGRPGLRGGEIWQERQSRNPKGESGPRKLLTYFNHHRLVSGKISGRNEGITRISKIH